MDKLIEINSYPAACVLEQLLSDKSTKKNIIWATDTYEEFGEKFSDKSQMNVSSLLRRSGIIRPRIEKSHEQQAKRTRKKAEVFTPAWLCNKMNNSLDEDWFGRKNVFNTENEDHTWTVTEGKIEFPRSKKWQHYVDSRRLEITCGEAPYLVSRYDVSTGELIVPPLRRIGMLDRKLRIVNENTDTYEQWLKWTIRAFEASYGYEYQGDNVLIARINLLMTFVDYYEERWQRQPDEKLLRQLANKIAHNIWQMDGIKDTVPLGKPYEEFRQLTLFDMVGIEDENAPQAMPCRIYNWRSKTSQKFMDLKEIRTMGKKLFDYVIGNPPYQDEMEGTSDNPTYNYFMDSSYSVATAVELITPARFLFDAGKTPKMWNRKMLSDEHLQVLYYEPDSSKVFSNTDIKGGVVVTYRDSRKKGEAIQTFTPFSELNTILSKVRSNTEKYLSDVVFAPESYKFTKEMYVDHPEILSMTMMVKGKEVPLISKGHDYDLTSNIFDKLHGIVFFDEPSDNRIAIFGRMGNERVNQYIEKSYIASHPNLGKYKVFFPKANGAGKFGEVMTASDIGEKNVGHTQTFISIGAFDTLEESKNLQKYLMCKFSRALLYVLKVTQDNKKPVWKYVPLQDFTENSDIDWSKSVHEIDLQLYRKYGLDEKEIEFIETHVKEME